MKRLVVGLLGLILLGGMSFIALQVLQQSPDEPKFGVGCKDDETKTISQRIEECDITQEETANMKGKEVAKVGPITKQNRGTYDIEILVTRTTEGGVDVFTKAWKGGKQVGFGDGSVEIERFRIFNPPILVADPNGPIIREWTDRNGDIHQLKYREDPQEALLQTLAHTIKVSEPNRGERNIIRGKVGNTTSTFFAYLDGKPHRGNSSNSEAFATIRAGAGTGVNRENAAEECDLWAHTTTDTWREIDRCIFAFFTGTIGNTDIVSSATLSFYGIGAQDDFDLAAVIDRKVLDSATTTYMADYDVGNWAGVEQAPRLDMDSWNTAGYNDFVLNATGISNISLTGSSWYGIRTSGDFDNSAPTWVSSALEAIILNMQDAVGTANDPKLVVVHACNPASSVCEETFFTPGLSTWTVPANVTTANMACWGAGGGGDVISTSAGGGGGGGAFASSTVSVTPTNVYNIVIGAGGVGATSPTIGATSSIALSGGASTTLAQGGREAVNTVAGAGGAIGTGQVIGDVKSAGGVGGGGVTTDDAGGGGGGAGGPAGTGGAGSVASATVGGGGGGGNAGGAGGQPTGGTAGSNGGVGGQGDSNGSTDPNGGPGAPGVYGGGGGGGGDNGDGGGNGGLPGGGGAGGEVDNTFGDGGNGMCTIAYTINAAPTTPKVIINAQTILQGAQVIIQ